MALPTTACKAVKVLQQLLLQRSLQMKTMMRWTVNPDVRRLTLVSSVNTAMLHTMLVLPACLNHCVINCTSVMRPALVLQNTRQALLH